MEGPRAPPLVPPYGTSSQQDPSWSTIPGSSPSWHSCNMQSQGRQHLTASHPSLLLDTKLANWGRADVLQSTQQK
jgi:hypothetical protein